MLNAILKLESQGENRDHCLGSNGVIYVGSNIKESASKMAVVDYRWRLESI